MRVLAVCVDKSIPFETAVISMTAGGLAVELEAGCPVDLERNFCMMITKTTATTCQWSVIDCVPLFVKEEMNVKDKHLFSGNNSNNGIQICSIPVQLSIIHIFDEIAPKVQILHFWVF